MAVSDQLHSPVALPLRNLFPLYTELEDGCTDVNCCCCCTIIIIIIIIIVVVVVHGKGRSGRFQCRHKHHHGVNI
jgi:hypothetical protein